MRTFNLCNVRLRYHNSGDFLLFSSLLQGVQKNTPTLILNFLVLFGTTCMFKPAAVCLIFIDTLFKKPIKDFICSVSRCLSDEFVYVFNERSTLTRYHLPSSHSLDDVDTDTLG